MSNIKLRCADGRIIITKLSLMRQSSVLNDMFKHCVPTHDAVIPLPQLHSEVLITVLNWLHYHQTYSHMSSQLLSSWDMYFFDTIKQTTLFDMIKAANYLKIKALLFASKRYVMVSFNGKTPQQLRDIFHLPNDFDFGDLPLTWNSDAAAYTIASPK